MEKRIYTAVDADEVEAGTYGYIADTMNSLKNMISRGDECIAQCASVKNDTYICRFGTIKGNIFALFVPVVSKGNWNAYRHYQNGGVVCSEDGKRYSKEGEVEELDWLNTKYDIGKADRLMTHKEFSRWLHAKPDREFKRSGNASVYSSLSYLETQEDKVIDDNIVVREGDSPWFVPFAGV